METVVVICDEVRSRGFDESSVEATLLNANVVDILNNMTLEKGLEALIDAHDFSQVFDAIIALQGESDEN